jgi:electron transfer flavoprotein-quinone oxidoreductase
VIDERFNIKGDEGVVIEMAGTVTSGMVGTAFIYTNGESLAVGIGCLVSDFKKSGHTPYSLLEQFKGHPSIAPLLKGSEVKEYAAHLIPEGGFKAIPKVYGDGWMTTGRLAAETVAALKAAGKPTTEANLARYRKALEESFVIKDLKKYKDLPEFLHRNTQFFNEYPNLLSKAAETWFRVDGVDKKTKEGQMVRGFVKARGWRGLLGDAVKLARAWR